MHVEARHLKPGARVLVAPSEVTPGHYARVSPAAQAYYGETAVYTTVLAVTPAPLGRGNATRGWKLVSTDLADIKTPADSTFITES